MKKISSILESLILTQPFLEDALLYGYLNLTAFAEYVQPHIQKELEKNVSTHAIKMALSRYQWAKNIIKYREKRNGFTKLSTRKWLNIITLSRTPKNLELTTQLLLDKGRQKNFLTIIEGIHEIDIVFEDELMPLIQEIFPKHFQLLMVSGLGLISGELSESEMTTPWLFYTVTKRLAFHGINIVQVLSTYHELWILVRDEDVKDAILVLMD